MMLTSSATATATATTNTTDHGINAAAEISDIHMDIIQAHILPRLDGQSLASTSCTSSQLNTLCHEKKLWKNVCNSSWPSTTDPLVHDTISTFPSGHRSFCSDAFSTIGSLLLLNRDGSKNFSEATPYNHLERSSKMSRLISAVDIHFEDKLICSRVIDTDTKSSWFSCSPFRVDLLEPKEIIPTLVKLHGDSDTCMSRVEKSLTLSWILIDPDTKRAINVSSITPVVVRRHWLTGEFQARYATIMPSESTEFGIGLVQCGVTVTCGGEDDEGIQVKEVSMLVEDMEGLIPTGKDSLVILEDAMDSDRKVKKFVDDKKNYENFVKVKNELNVNYQTKEKRLDMVYVVTGIMMFMSLCTFVLF